MLKINDKVKIQKRGEDGGAWNECGRGFVRQIFTDRLGEIKFISYNDKEWPSEITETVSVNAPFFRVVAN